MMRIPLNRADSVPLYTQIYQFLRQQIETEALVVGSRLPASRELAADLGVSRVTVINAIAELEAEGFVVSVQGSGAFVADWPLLVEPIVGETAVSLWPQWQTDSASQSNVSLYSAHESQIKACTHPDLIQFASGMGSTEVFNLDEFRKTFQAVLRRDGAKALGYGDTTHGGYEPLRHTIAQILSNSGIPTHAENVLITSGSQQAISLVAQLLVKPGETILVESPTYEGGLNLFRSLGVKLIGVPVDEDGMDMAALEAALQTHRPKLIYTIPTFHNPTGTSLDTQRRRQMVTLARQYNVPILEDDFAGELRYEGYAQPALKALDTDGTVIYVNTFSKALVPGLRLGFLVANGPIYEQLVIHKRASDRSSSDMMQRALDAYITVGRYQAQLRKVCGIYRRRRNGMLAALEQFMPEGVVWQRPFGGLFLWLQLPDGMDAAELLPVALQEGVAFVPGSAFFVDKRPFSALRLNFTAHDPEIIEVGIERLGSAIKKFI